MSCVNGIESFVCEWDCLCPGQRDWLCHVSKGFSDSRENWTDRSCVNRIKAVPCMNGIGYIMSV